MGTARKMGSPLAFAAAVLLIVIWAASYKLFTSFDSFQLVINSVTTVITFLMGFLILATQNHDSRAIHLKLDELIRVTKARNAFANLEEATEEELDRYHAEFLALREKRRSKSPER